MQKVQAIIILIILNQLISLKVYAHGEEEYRQGESFYERYSFFELWSPHIIFILILIFLLYLKGIKYVNYKSDQPVSLPKIVSFITGLVVFYSATGSPLHLLGDDYLFSVHMLNQSLVYLALPPLILYGTPELLVKPFVIKALQYKVMSFLLRPLVSLLLFNVLFSFYHIPFLFDTIVANSFLHNLTHATLTFTAFLMWATVVPMTSELDQISPLLKIGYMFAAGMLLTPACALIIFSDSVLYTSYNNVLFDINPLQDQNLGGIVMKVFQEFVYIPVMGYIFYKWRKQERIYDIDEIPKDMEEVKI